MRRRYHVRQQHHHDRRLLASDRDRVPYYLHGDADNGHLHSFPTRRSSDLPPSGGVTSTRSPPYLLVVRHFSVPPSLAGRSDEHTSELQSQSNLVCRLLLEKKKDRVPNRHPLVPELGHEKTLPMAGHRDPGV